VKNEEKYTMSKEHVQLHLKKCWQNVCFLCHRERNSLIMEWFLGQISVLHQISNYNLGHIAPISLSEINLVIGNMRKMRRALEDKQI